MVGLKEMLLAEQRRLEKIIHTSQRELKNAPEGTLRLSTSQNRPQYYHCTKNSKKNGTYISRENKFLIQQLAQKSYNEKVLKCAEKRLSQIRKITKDYNDHEIEEIFEKEHIERKKLIQPVEPTWEQKMKSWAAEVYQGKEFQDNVPLIFTERGERVRSKSEKIMADYFFRNNIEYKYERPLLLKGYGTVYPDFTFLSRRTGEEIYWEHDGKMDDPTYARNAVKKIEAYENNNIFPGERLILTFETEYTILSTKTIEKLVEKYLN
ncbi:MAG: hypothetical protein MR406_05455 [Blautia sp.]|nr:hypothetical protein [Blautia sp.]MDY5664903.1 hypothetical protein [Blautia sp.]